MLLAWCQFRQFNYYSCAACPKCALSNKGDFTCCANGGSWAGECGRVVTDQFKHTWVEGLKVCKKRRAEAAEVGIAVETWNATKKHLHAVSAAIRSLNIAILTLCMSTIFFWSSSIGGLQQLRKKVSNRSHVIFYGMKSSLQIMCVHVYGLE